LRGDQRTQGEQSRKEGGKIFGSGSRTPIAITLLVKDESNNHKIYYHDIGNYLSQKNKLNFISNYHSIKGMKWQEIIPDKNNDWINQRNENYNTFLSLYKDIFLGKLVGVSTSRDAWVYNFSYNPCVDNAQSMVKNYNSEIERLKNINDKNTLLEKANTSSDFIN